MIENKENKQIYNYRRVKQKQELEAIKPYAREIDEKAKFKVVKYYWNTIKQNFMMYNSATTDLIIKLQQNIYQNVRLNGIKTTYMIKPKQLCFYNKELGISENVNTIKSRLNILVEEGVIKKISTNRGSFYYFLVDIDKPFDRKQFKTYKSKDNTTYNNNIVELKTEDKMFHEEQEKVISDREIRIQQAKLRLQQQLLEENKQQQDKANKENTEYTDWLVAEQKEIEELINKNTENNLQNKIKELDKEIAENGVVEEIEEVEKEQDDTIEARDQKIIDRLNAIDIGDNSRAQFINYFFEFISPRQNNKGVKLKAKSDRAIEMTLKQLEKAKDEGVDAYNMLDECLANCWQGLFPTDYSRINKKPKTQIAYYGYRDFCDKGLNLKLQDYNKVIEEINKQDGQTRDEIIQKTTQYQVQALSTLATEKAKEDTLKMLKEEMQRAISEKADISLRVITACKSFHPLKPINVNLWLNILDKGVGKKTYFALYEYYASKIQNKYPQDKERINTFGALFQSVLTIANERKISYIPVYAVYELLNKKTSNENWDNCIDFSMFDSLYKEEYLIRFLTDNFFVKKYEDCYSNGWFKELKSIEFGGFSSKNEELNKYHKDIIQTFLFKVAKGNISAYLLDIVKGIVEVELALEKKEITKLPLDIFKEYKQVFFKEDNELLNEKQHFIKNTLISVCEMLYKKVKEK